MGIDSEPQNIDSGESQKELRDIFVSQLITPENRVRQDIAEECIKLFDELVKKRPDRAQLHVNNLKRCIKLSLPEEALNHEIKTLIEEGIKLDLKS